MIGVAAKEENHQIVPNPGSDKIKVILNDFSSVSSVTAVNMSGMVISNLAPSSIDNGALICDVSGLSPGLWFLHIKGPEKNVILKLAVVR